VSSVPPIDGEAAISLLLRLLAVEGTTGREGAIGREIAAVLAELGIPESAIRFDDAHQRIPLPTEQGNLLVEVAGDATLAPRLFVAHRDTVPLCAGARPERRGDRIFPAGPTALGGDDRTGVAAVLTAVATLRRAGSRHPPLRLLFTVREESGVWGARTLDPLLLRGAAMGFNVDGGTPAELVVGAVGSWRWEVEVTGRAAHAGLHPEQGISAPMVAAMALATAQRRGWFGRVRRAGGAGTSNVGQLAGRDGGRVGGPHNVVADYVRVEGEARSHDPRFIPRIVAGFRRAFHDAARRLPASDGAMAVVETRDERLYDPFVLPEDAPVVAFARERARGLGIEPTLRVADGGLDANWLVRHGVPTVSFGAGQRAIHSVDEHVDIADFLAGCRLALALAIA
jgi:tripeptide aminopeptidase